MQAFILRITPSGVDRVHEALASGELIIGWSYAKGLQDPSLTRHQFRDIIHQTYHSQRSDFREAGLGAGNMWRFISEMRVGDIVLVPHGPEFYLGRVAGPAYYDETHVAHDTAYRRPVEWLNLAQPLPRAVPAPALQARMRSQLTCINATDLLADVLALPISWMPLATPEAVDLSASDPPPRALTTTYRVLRDTALARRLKALHGDQCQLCSFVIVLPDGGTYSEAHHIQPLGGAHRGPDIAQNILVLCPNHHAMCDYGAVTLDLDNIRSHPDHPVGPEFITYHNKWVYQGRTSVL